MGGASRDPEQVRERCRVNLCGPVLKCSACRAPLTSDGVTPSAASARSSSCDEEEARDAAVQASPPLSSSKSLQTDEAPPPQQVRQLQVSDRQCQAM